MEPLPKNVSEMGFRLSSNGLFDVKIAEDKVKEKAGCSSKGGSKWLRVKRPKDLRAFSEEYRGLRKRESERLLVEGKS